MCAKDFVEKCSRMGWGILIHTKVSLQSKTHRVSYQLTFYLSKDIGHLGALKTNEIVGEGYDNYTATVSVALAKENTMNYNCKPF